MSLDWAYPVDAGLWMMLAALLIISQGMGRGTDTCPSLPLSVLRYALDSSSDLSLPCFPLLLFPDLSDEQVRGELPVLS